MGNLDKMDYLELFKSGILPGTETCVFLSVPVIQPEQQRYNPPVVFDLLVAFSSINWDCLLDCLQGNRREGISASYVGNSSHGKEEEFDP